MFKNKKGLASGLVIIFVMMFVFALSSLFAITMWNSFNHFIQYSSNETITPEVKEQINLLGNKMLWADKLFTLFYVALIVSYFISASTIPSDKPVYFLVFLGLLVIVTILSMIISNMWTFLTLQDSLTVASESLTFTNWFMKYFPIISFFTGIVGAVIFYTRNNQTGRYGGANDAIE